MKTGLADHGRHILRGEWVNAVTRPRYHFRREGLSAPMIPVKVRLPGLASLGTLSATDNARVALIQKLFTAMGCPLAGIGLIAAPARRAAFRAPVFEKTEAVGFEAGFCGPSFIDSLLLFALTWSVALVVWIISVLKQWEMWYSRILVISIGLESTPIPFSRVRPPSQRRIAVSMIDGTFGRRSRARPSLSILCEWRLQRVSRTGSGQTPGWRSLLGFFGSARRHQSVPLRSR